MRGSAPRVASRRKLALIGANGRLGSAIREVLHDSSFRLAATIERSKHVRAGSLAAKADVVLDVSLPRASQGYLRELTKARARIPYVIGCTGWTPSQLKAVHAYAEHACVVLAPNFAPVVNLLLSLVEHAAPLLANWGFDCAIHEIHHRKKRDAPSGTAKALSEKLLRLNPQIHSTRAGEVVGTHEVRFIGKSDLLCLTHQALDRSIFARGALLAAGWACRQETAGLYSMRDVIFG